MELLRKKHDETPDEQNPEICMRGRDLYAMADTANLLAKSDDYCSLEIDTAQNRDMEFPAFKDSNSSEDSQSEMKNMTITANVDPMSKTMVKLSGEASMT